MLSVLSLGWFRLNWDDPRQPLLSVLVYARSCMWVKCVEPNIVSLVFLSEWKSKMRNDKIVSIDFSVK
jgi:hypothetical protein